MKIHVAVVLWLCGSQLLLRAQGDFSVLNTNAFKSAAPTDNPFESFSADEVDHIVITSEGGRKPVMQFRSTNRSTIAGLCSAALACEFADQWVTLSGGALASVDFMDEANNRIVRVSVNNVFCEFTVRAAKGDRTVLGTSCSHEFVRTVYDLMKSREKLPWMTRQFEEKLLSPKPPPVKSEPGVQVWHKGG